MGDGQLPARLQPGNDQRGEHGARGIDRSRVAGRILDPIMMTLEWRYGSGSWQAVSSWVSLLRAGSGAVNERLLRGFGVVRLAQQAVQQGLFPLTLRIDRAGARRVRSRQTGSAGWRRRHGWHASPVSAH